jgi:hypothetical protein
MSARAERTITLPDTYLNVMARWQRDPVCTYCKLPREGHRRIAWGSEHFMSIKRQVKSGFRFTWLPERVEVVA